MSGTNVAIVGAAATGVARRLRLGPAAAALVAGCAVVAFVVLARPSGSVLRAAVMGLIGLAGVVAARPRAALTGLSGAVFILLLADPALAVAPGFALSVVATLGLLVLAPRWSAVLARRTPRWLADALAIPAAAQVACGPLIAMIGGGLSLVAIPANMLAAPAVAPATISGVCAAAVAPISGAPATGLAYFAALPCLALFAIAFGGARLPGATVPWPDGARGAALMVVATVGVAAAVVAARHAILRCAYRRPC